MFIGAYIERYTRKSRSCKNTGNESRKISFGILFFFHFEMVNDEEVATK